MIQVVINNKTGAGGTTGVEYAMQQPADGYTWLLCTQSPLLAQLTGAATTDVKGGITPVGLPDDWPILIDEAVVAAGPVVIGLSVPAATSFSNVALPQETKPSGGFLRCTRLSFAGSPPAFASRRAPSGS